ncbi:MAG: DUF58 domain-containing protein [Clostridia bacterium]
MTRRAALFMLVAATALVAALSTGARLYYLMLISMGMMLVIGLASVILALFTVRATIRCARHTIERGVSVPIIATVRHMSLIPVRLIALKLALPDDAGAPEALELDPLPFIQKDYELEITCPHRGVYPIGVTAMAASDVFGLFRLSRKVENCFFQVEVVPRLRRLPAMALSPGDMEDNRLTRMTEDNASPADVRAWRTGDALKKVHWKLSMRKRELMVRTYEESLKPDTLILIDLSPPTTLKSHALSIEDTVIETAGSIAQAQLTAGYPVRMPLMSAQPTEARGENRAALGAFTQALTHVAFDSPFSFDKLLMLEMRRMQRTGGAVLITPKLNARVADLATQLHHGGMRVTMCYVTDNRREETEQLLSQLTRVGITAYRVDPWGEGLTEAEMIERTTHG